MAYSGVTETLALLPGFPQTTTEDAYSETVVMLGDQVIRADSKIDSMLSEKYAIPLNGAATHTSAVPPVIRTFSQDLTKAFAMHAFYTRDNVNVSERADKLEETVMAALKDLAKGKGNIPLTSGSLLPRLDESGRVASTTESFAPTYLEDHPLNQSVDSNKLDAIRDSRA